MIALDAHDYRAAAGTIDANRRRRTAWTVGECWACGSGLTQKAVDNGWFIHLHVDGTLIPAAADVDDDHGSQGWFPVGPDCAKRIPRTHRVKGQ
jgi:hypothetical protein